MGGHDLEVPFELTAQIHAEPSGRCGQIPLDAGGAEQADALLDDQIPLYLSAHPDHLCKNLPHHLGGFAEIHLLIARDLPNANAVDAKVYKATTIFILNYLWYEIQKNSKLDYDNT